MARQQAQQVAETLSSLGHQVEMVFIKTSGDKHADIPVSQAPERGIFTKELQQALLDGKIDLAVHSLKDVPTDPVSGLRITAVLPRGSPFDVVILRDQADLSALQAPITVGTGSLRRQAQLLYLFPQLRMQPIRGNVDTRLRKLEAGQVDALVLAEAALLRLSLASRSYVRLPGAFVLPAPGQGAIAVETCTEASEVNGIVGRLDHWPSRAAVEAERAFLRNLKGGCLAPVAALAMLRGDRLILAGRVLSPDGRRRLDGTLSAPAQTAETLGAKLAEQLIAKGAAELIAQARGLHPSSGEQTAC